MKSTIKHWITLGTALFIFAVLIMMIDMNKAIAVLLKANIALLMYAGAISLLFPVLCAVRWMILCKIINTPIGLWESIQIIMAAWLLGAITPAKSGDLIKVVYLQDKLPYSTTTGIVLAERVVDVFVLGLFAFIFGYILDIKAGLFTGAFVLGAVGFYIILVFSHLTTLLPSIIRGKIDNAALASRLMCSQPVALLLIILVTGLNWFLTFYQTWICYHALQTSVPLMLITAGLPAAIFAGLLPITPAGMGTRDAAIMVLFSHYASAEVNLSVGILYSILGYWFLAVLGIPFMRSALNGAFQHIAAKELAAKIH